MEKEFDYVAPQVTVIEVEVEKGFVTSNEGIGEGPEYPMD